MRGNLLGLAALILASMSLGLSSEKYVTVTAPSSSVVVEKGKSAVIQIFLRPAAGIHINAEPKITTESLTEGVSFKVKAVYASGEYLDSSKPVSVECFAANFIPGPHKAVMIVRYTYCSEREKWCRMGSDSIAVDLRMKQ